MASRTITTSLAVLILLATLSATWAADESSPIRLNTIGFLPNKPKTASIATTCTRFIVVRLDNGAKVLEGPTTGPILNEDTQEPLYLADFSALKEPGGYRLEIPEAGRSAPFSVSENIYNQPFYTVVRGMYLWRCGTAVSATHNGQTFAHEACHTNDAWLDSVGGGHEKKDGLKGWHDAGDYNKYVVNAGITVGSMFRAWEDFGPAIRKIRLDLPESGRGPIPDFLDEIKWEIDWLLTMQAADGSVYHKISTPRFGPFILPERETTERYFTPWSSAATADFVAMTALAARHFRPYDAVYADRCLAAAMKSYEFLQANPDDHRADLTGFSTGAYQTRDADDRLWAAAELWATTGDAAVLRDFETRVQSMPAGGGFGRRFEAQPAAPTFGGAVDRDFDWGNVKNLALFTYLASKRPGRDPALVEKIRQSLIDAADAIVKTRDAHGYARPLGTRYYWGCNGSVARQTMVLRAAHRIAPKPEYLDTALDALNHLFGRNYYGRSFVTGLGHRPPMNPHDRRSGGDDVEAPWPGYLVGGPHPRATSWGDTEKDYRTNEIAINWNGALIYALAGFLGDERNPPLHLAE